MMLSLLCLASKEDINSSAGDSWPQTNPNLYLRYSNEIAGVERAILPSYRGRVKYQVVAWRAQCEQNISFQKGDRVLVIGRCDNTLIVQPLICDG